LVELIDRHKKWKESNAAGRESSSEDDHKQDKPTEGGPIWKFNDTVKGTPAELHEENSKEVQPAVKASDEKPPAGVKKSTKRTA